MSDTRTFGRMYELRIGERFGRLLVTQVRPGLVMLCDCGTEVRNRTPSQVAEGRLKSCGCGRSPKKTVGTKHNDWLLVRLVEDGSKAAARKWLVECKCGYQALKWESDLKANVIACNACRRAAVAKEGA